MYQNIGYHMTCNDIIDIILARVTVIECQWMHVCLLSQYLLYLCWLTVLNIDTVLIFITNIWLLGFCLYQASNCYFPTKHGYYFTEKKPKHKKDTFNDNIGNQGKKKYMGTLTIFNVYFFNVMQRLNIQIITVEDNLQIFRFFRNFTWTV